MDQKHTERSLEACMLCMAASNEAAAFRYLCWREDDGRIGGQQPTTGSRVLQLRMRDGKGRVLLQTRRPSEFRQATSNAPATVGLNGVVIIAI